MKSTAQKICQPVFSRKPQSIKLYKANSDELCFSSINHMIQGRIQRDAKLLMSISDSNAHI